MTTSSSEAEPSQAAQPTTTSPHTEAASSTAPTTSLQQHVLPAAAATDLERTRLSSSVAEATSTPPAPSPPVAPTSTSASTSLDPPFLPEASSSTIIDSPTAKADVDLPSAHDTRMRASSHVDQLGTHPAASPPRLEGLHVVTPDSTIRSSEIGAVGLGVEEPTPLVAALSQDIESPILHRPDVLINEPDMSTTTTTTTTTRKPHPADLVTASNPDPHRSNPSTPALQSSTVSENPLTTIITSTTTEEGSKRNDDNSEVASENGAALGHEEDEETAVEETSISRQANMKAVEPINGVERSRNELEESPSIITPSTTTTTTSVLTDPSINDDDDIPLARNRPISVIAAPTPSTPSSRTPLDSTTVSNQLAPLPPATPPKANGTPRDPSSEQREAKRQERREREREKEKEAQRSATGATSSSSRSRRVLGEYTMSKTLGAGSMGKVKLGISNVSGEKVAIKIIPRFTSTAAAHRPPPPSENSKTPVEPHKPPTASFLAKAAAKDQSKEVRTMREGSLCLLLHHPYICGMKAMMLYPHHYYMVTEYVNGGQMLDYIISHGRLRERSARKFARQIGSALEYCHANSIVHRDLKIENILISKTGNIKIIDFGLSNLYSPTSQLSTFCGSLYFAAPELLNAKPYCGPEVDVWSFGIVLYVLVCGKVPFDDQSMPALHAKIKRGQVEYPSWLSAECKHLLSRMLVTNPTTRATLSEVLGHPWTVKGFTGPPSSHLPHRTPLRIEDLDREIIKGMVGFELGTDEEIYDSLTQVLVSDSYRSAVRVWETKRGRIGGTNGDSPETERPATRVDGKDMKGLGRSPTNKRFSGIGFYGKKLAGGINAAFASGASASNGKGLDEIGGVSNTDEKSMMINGTSSSGGIKLDVDPTKGFHPLISIYYLVKEKQERERIWGPGVFASSTLSLTGPPPPPAPAIAYQGGSIPAPPATAPHIPAPLSLPTQLPVASPRMPMTPQPRQRASGDEYSSHPSTAPQSLRTNDYSSGAGFAANKRTSYHSGSSAPPTATQYNGRPATSYEPSSPTLARKSLAATAADDSTIVSPASDDVPLASSPSGNFARRFSSLLGRSSPSPASDTASKQSHRQRASFGGGMTHKAGTKTAATALPQVTETPPSSEGPSTPIRPAPTLRPSGSDVPLPSPTEGQGVTRASTMGESSPSRHQRGVSMGASSGRAMANQASNGRPSSAAGPSVGPASMIMPRSGNSTGTDKAFSATEYSDQDAEELAIVQSSEAEDHPDDAVPSRRPHQDVGFVGRTAQGNTDAVKPVWGLWNTSTTTTKSVATIRADLIRVLDRLGVQHRDVKSGFECAHVPSIDLSSVGGGGKEKQGKGTIRRRASRILLGGAKDKDSTSMTAGEESSTSLNQANPGGFAHGSDREGQRTSSTSFNADAPVPPSQSPVLGQSTKSEAGPQFTSSTGEGSSVSSDLIVRFEIFIVRLPLLPGINGLQFRRIGGNAWQYQMLARRVLSELKL